MMIPSWLLFGLGLLGATDILLFHVRAHDLRHHPECRRELITHFLRGPTYAVLFLAVPNFQFFGGWLLALYGLLAFDLAISIADFWLEPESRRALGGLPRGEYLLHVLLAMLFGALVASIAYESAGRLSMPTGLIRLSLVPAPLRLALAVMAPIVLATGLADLAAVRRLSRQAG